MKASRKDRKAVAAACDRGRFVTRPRYEPLGTYIRPDQARALRAHSEATCVPVAVLVRQALDLFLAVQSYPLSWQAAGRVTLAADETLDAGGL